MINNIKHIAFDLDGTLIDSADSVLETLQFTLSSHSLTANRAVNRELIGPSIRELLTSLTGIKDPETIESMHSFYLDRYNDHGHKNAVPYLGIEKLLQTLKDQDIDLYIVTNKCQKSTSKIIDNLEWNSTFEAVHCVEPFSLSRDNKTKLLKHLALSKRIDLSEIVYIGDRFEDYVAADAQGIQFIGVSWGYGDWSNTAFSGLVCDLPIELTERADSLPAYVPISSSFHKTKYKGASDESVTG